MVMLHVLHSSKEEVRHRGCLAELEQMLPVVLEEAGP